MRSAEHSLDEFSQALGELADERGRYKPTPPGRCGFIAVVVDLGTHESPFPVVPGIASRAGTIGPRVAISAAALGKDEPAEGHNVISSMLEGVYEDTAASGGGLFEGALNWLLGLWGAVLQFYCDGVDAVTGGIEQALGSIDMGESTLGAWAKEQLLSLLRWLGIEPLDLSTPKPVTVNSAYVLGKSGLPVTETLQGLRSILGVGRKVDELTIEGPFGRPITIKLPETPDELPEAIEQTLSGVLGGA